MTSPVKLVGRTRAQFQASSFHLDSGNWPGDEAENVDISNVAYFMRIDVQK